MSALISFEVSIERLRSEIAQLEARYDGIFPPGVYAVLEDLRRQLATLHKAPWSECCEIMQAVFIGQTYIDVTFLTDHMPTGTTVADDWLGRMFMDMAAKYGAAIHTRKVHASSLSFIMPSNGKRAIVRCRDDDYLYPFPILHLAGCRALHLDGHRPDVAIHYAKLCPPDGDSHVARRWKTAVEHSQTS